MRAVDVAGFFARVWGQVTAAEDAAGVVTERWFEIAGQTLRLRFIGSALLRIIAPALSHLECAPPSRRANLTLHCWDCQSLGMEFPRAPVTREGFTPRGEVQGLNDARYRAAFEAEGQLLSLMDTLLEEAVYCVGIANNIPRFDVAEPIRAILSWFMRESGRQLLHAGAVGTRTGGVLLIGPSGAGKSNTALSCLASSLSYASDDFCAVTTTGTPMVYSLYSTGKTHERDWNRHPFLSQLAANLDPERRDKVIYFLNEAVPHKLIASFPLKAILLPRNSSKNCTVIRVPSVAAVRASAPDTARLLPDAGPEVLRCIAHLVRSVPCYEFQLGARPEIIPDVITTLLAKLSDEPNA